VGDVDLSRALITVHQAKNGERRALPLAGHALALVKDMAKVPRLGTALVFPSHLDPAKPVDNRNIFD
jgi:integrase